MHIPDDPLYFEKYYFTPGDLGFKAWQTKFGRIGVLICWDQWYPEAARLTALQDCSVLFYPTAIGWHPQGKGPFLRRSPISVPPGKPSSVPMPSANGIYVASPNRIGLEKIAAHAGDGIEIALVVASSPTPSAAFPQKGSRDKEEILIAEVDPKLQEETRRNWPFLRDRRIDAYGGITQRFGK